MKKIIQDYWVNLNEHALLKIDYQTLIGNLGDQVITNCILLIQCRYDRNSQYLQNKNHWKIELRAHILNCSEKKLKKNNTYDKRLKYIKYIWLDGLELLTDQTRINRIICDINKKENTAILFNSEFQTILDTIFNKIIELIAEGDSNKITKYIERL